MKNSLTQQIRNWTPGRTSHFLLTQLAHTAFTLTVLAALLLGAARVGALDGVMAPAAPVSVASFTSVNYQGRLADSSGNPIDNTNPGLGMTFALYDTDTGGSPLWNETHANVPVANGLFSVRLGSINALSTDLLTGDRWLAIQVGTDPEMTPREELAAVPYAMQSGLALTVADGSITSEKLAADALPVFTVSTTETSWQVPACDNSYYPIPGLSLNFTVDESSTLLVDFTGLGYNSVTGAYIYAVIFVDGERIMTSSDVPLLGGCRNMGSGVTGPWCTLANSVAQPLDPGSHTIDMRVQCNDSGVAKVHSGWLRVILLP